MSGVAVLLDAERPDGGRRLLDRSGWARLAATLGEAHPAALALLGLWAEAEPAGEGRVQALLLEGRSRPLVASVAVEAGRYLSLSGASRLAAPFERRIRDLHGFEAMHAADLRAVLDHGRWTATAPLAPRPGPPPRGAEPPEWREGSDGPFDPGAGARIERGPVGAPGAPAVRERLTLDGERVASIEWQIGYGHRGVAAAIAGRPVATAAERVARIDVEATAAHAAAFARAVERARGVEPPPRGDALRAAALALGRAGGSLAVLLRVARAAGARGFAAEAAELLADLAPLAEAGLGHRRGIGFVQPGGVARDPGAAGCAALAEAAALLADGSARLARRNEGWTGLSRRLRGLGTVGAAEAAALGLAAVEPGASPALRGDAESRVRARIAAVAAAAGGLAAALEAAAGADGPVRAAEPAATAAPADGIGVATGPAGEIWQVVRLDAAGNVAAWFSSEPSIALLALLEGMGCACPSDAAPIAASLGLSVAGLDG